MGKQFRKRKASDEEDDEEERRLALEEVKLLQKQRERKSGVTAIPPSNPSGALLKNPDKLELEGDKEELVLQDTFAQETAVNVEDPNMLKYVEQELAKRRGKQETGDHGSAGKPPEDDLYVIPDHLKVRKRNAEESSTQWTTGIAEVQLPIEYKLKNIEETEAAKKQLQDKKSYISKPRLHNNNNHAPSDNANGGRNRRQTATDEIMLERFRKRERSRLMRR